MAQVFLWLESDLILTAYHVVENAREISLFLKNTETNQVTVEHYSPEYDLATLRITDKQWLADAKLSGATPIEGDRNPKMGPAFSAYALAHPISSPNLHRLEAKFTTDDFVKSSSYSIKLFSRNTIKLISIDMTVYGGMSSAPLLQNGLVIGVVSGSLTEGGLLSWAISIRYANELKAASRLMDRLSLYENQSGVKRVAGLLLPSDMNWYIRRITDLLESGLRESDHVDALRADARAATIQTLDV